MITNRNGTLMMFNLLRKFTHVNPFQEYTTLLREFAHIQVYTQVNLINLKKKTPFH